MIEILGSNLEPLFKQSGLKAKCTYKQTMAWKGYDTLYEVWEVDDETYKTMFDMSEEEFASYYPNDAEVSNIWWNGPVSDNQRTTIMCSPNATYVIDGHKIRAWDGDGCLAYSSAKTVRTGYRENVTSAIQPTSVTKGNMIL